MSVTIRSALAVARDSETSECVAREGEAALRVRFTVRVALVSSARRIAGSTTRLVVFTVRDIE